MKKPIFGLLAVALILGPAVRAAAAPLRQDAERLQIVRSEGWADLYFSGLTAAALDNFSTSGVPKTLAELEKSKYLLWIPKTELKVSDASKALTQGRMFSKRDLADFETTLLTRKHHGDFALKPGEVLIAYSDGEVLFAAGIKDGDQAAMYGPKKIEIRRSPNTVDSFLYRQVRKAVEIYEAKNAKMPAALKDLADAAGAENKAAFAKRALDAWFAKAVDEVNAP